MLLQTDLCSYAILYTDAKYPCNAMVVWYACRYSVELKIMVGHRPFSDPLQHEHTRKIYSTFSMEKPMILSNDLPTFNEWLIPYFELCNVKSKLVQSNVLQQQIFLDKLYCKYVR